MKQILDTEKGIWKLQQSSRWVINNFERTQWHCKKWFFPCVDSVNTLISRQRSIFPFFTSLLHHRCIPRYFLDPPILFNRVNYIVNKLLSKERVSESHRVRKKAKTGHERGWFSLRKGTNIVGSSLDCRIVRISEKAITIGEKGPDRFIGPRGSSTHYYR